MIFNFINEAYFGKTPELLEAEKYIGKFRKKYMGKYITNIFVNQDKDLLKVNRILEDFFGLGCMSITVQNVSIANAMTMPIDHRIEYMLDKDAVLVDKNGFKFNKDADYTMIIYIYSGIMFNPDITDGEIMAVLLHEIGHNFNSCMNKKVGVMTKIYTSIYAMKNIVNLNIYGLLSLSDKAVGFDKKLTRKIREKDIKILRIPMDILQWVDDMFINGIFNIIQIKNMIIILTGKIDIIKTILNKFENPLDLLFLKTDYIAERESDNFATIYGYGQETISIQRKFDTSEAEQGMLIKRVFNKIPLLPAFYNLFLESIMIIPSIFESHPETIDRCTDQLALLKRELTKTDLDPKMRNTILQDIKACEKELDKLSQVDFSLVDAHLFKKLYNKMLMKVFGGKTFKNLLLDDKHRFDEYDKAYEKLKK